VNSGDTLAVRLVKLNFIQRLLTPAKVTWKDVLFTLAGSLIWLALVQVRPWIIHTRCANDPSLCDAKTVGQMDRYALSHDSPRADELSYETQNFSGIWAYSLPLVLQVGRIALQAEPVGLAVTLVLQDSLIISETIVLNGALNEAARLIVQRPRPFVYNDPGYHGSDPHNYTSFYSGHTSFTAAANLALLFVMMGRTAAISLLMLVGASGPILIFMTGFFRVLSGRHFFTDVVTGAIMGALVAVFVAFFHRTKIAPLPEDAHTHN